MTIRQQLTKGEWRFVLYSSDAYDRRIEDKINHAIGLMQKTGTIWVTVEARTPYDVRRLFISQDEDTEKWGRKTKELAKSHIVICNAKIE